MSTDTNEGGADDGAANLRTGSARYLGKSVLRLLYVALCTAGGVAGGIAAASLGLACFGTFGAHGYGGFIVLFFGMVAGGLLGLGTSWHAVRRRTPSVQTRLAIGIGLLAGVLVLLTLLIGRDGAG